MADLARKADLVPQTIAKMEKGLPTSRNSRLKVVKALDKKYDEVFYDESAMKETLKTGGRRKKG